MPVVLRSATEADAKHVESPTRRTNGNKIGLEHALSS
jgi:hypothetical protein